MDYKDDVKYPETCKKACEKAIIINTIQCGPDAECMKAWKDILRQGGRVLTSRSPRRAASSPSPRRSTRTCPPSTPSWPRRRSSTAGRDEQRRGLEKNDAVGKLAPEAAASRVAFQAKNAQCAAYDLLDGIKQGKIKLEDLKKEEMPEQMRAMAPKEQKEYLAKLEERRKELNAKCLELDKKRGAFIAKKQAEDAAKGKGGFDNQVLEVLRSQAKKNGIDY